MATLEATRRPPQPGTLHRRPALERARRWLLVGATLAWFGAAMAATVWAEPAGRDEPRGVAPPRCAPTSPAGFGDVGTKTLRRAEASTAGLGQESHEPICQDLGIGADGSVRGRIEWFEGHGRPDSSDLAEENFRNWQVMLWADDHPAAHAIADGEGYFCFRNVAPGRYTIVAGSKPPVFSGPVFSGPVFSSPVLSGIVRLWAPGTSPPAAGDQMVLHADRRVLRGQQPFPFLSFRDAATAVAIAGGAVAAPIIYHNARIENRIPRSE